MNLIRDCERVESTFWVDGSSIVLWLINGYNPYERLGTQVLREVYKRCKYTIHFASNSQQDRIAINGKFNPRRT